MITFKAALPILPKPLIAILFIYPYRLALQVQIKDHSFPMSFSIFMPEDKKKKLLLEQQLHVFGLVFSTFSASK